MSSRDPRFTGKVLLVTLAGSWCPNSHDEAAVLAALAASTGPVAWKSSR